MSVEPAATSRPHMRRRRESSRSSSALGDYLRGAALILDFTGSLSRRRISTMRYPRTPMRSLRIGTPWEPTCVRR